MVEFQASHYLVKKIKKSQGILVDPRKKSGHGLSLVNVKCIRKAFTKTMSFLGNAQERKTSKLFEWINAKSICRRECC